MKCVYCQREIGNNDKYELFGGDLVHIHCFQIIGVELTDTPWEEMLPREQDAINTYLSIESQEQQEVM
jgi:hypothetical protein